MSGEEKWIISEYKGKQILINSYCGLDIKGIIKQVGENLNRYNAEKKKDLLLLVDVTECPFDAEVVSEFHKIAKAIKPYIKKSAVIGVTGLKGVVLSTVNRISELGIVPYKTREEALDWLVS